MAYALANILHIKYSTNYVPSKRREWGGTIQESIGEIDDIVRSEQWHSVVAREKKGSTTVEYLVLALKDNDKWVRYAAADALGNIGDACCVGPLIRLLQDHDQDIRLVTVEALGKLGGPNACSALRTTYTTDQGSIKIAAEKALDQLNH